MPDVTVSADIDAFMVAANDAAARGELALTSIALVTPGTGVNTALAINVGSAGAFLTFNGAAGTPSSINLSNGTALPVGSITGLGAGVGTFLATPSGANLATALTTALPATKGGTGLTALGTGVATALGVNANAGGGLIVLADPGADRIPFWDDSAGAYVFLTVGTGLDLTTTTLTATANANAVTLASAAAGAGLLIVSAGADRTASATDTVATINATTANVTTLQMAENGDIKLDAALSADGKYCGITEAGTAGATLAFGDCVYLAAADSRWELADADAASTSGEVKIGMCVLAAAADGDPTTILLYGKIRADAVFPAFTISAPVYIGTTAGDVQVAQPSGTDDVIRVVGYGNTADELFFCPSSFYITHT
jgi:hypothetical protein